MNRGLAYSVSAIFHPVLVNFLSLFLLFQLFPALSHGVPNRLKVYYLSYLFITTALVPLILVFSLRLTGKIKSLSMEDKEERKLPYLVTFLMFVFNYYNLSKYSVPPLLLSWILVGAITMLLILMVNYFYKISLHAASLGSLLGLLCVAAIHTSSDLRPALAIAFLLSGLVCSSRLFLKAHDTAQIYLGFCSGFFFMLLIL